MMFLKENDICKVKTGVDESAEIQSKTSSTPKYGTDFDETFCPVVRQESLCLLMALSVRHDLHLCQVDITVTFLHGILEEEVYMQQPMQRVCVCVRKGYVG